MDWERKVFLACIGLLLAVGLLMVHSASMTARPTEFEQIYVGRQAMFIVLGLFLAVLASHVPVSQWQRWAPWLFAFTIVLLIAVLIPGVGSRVNGARRWLRQGALSFQPAELAKLAVPLMVASLAFRHPAALRRWWGTISLIWPVLLVAPLVLLEPDLGTTVFLLGGAGLTLALCGWPTRYFLVAGLGIIPTLVGLLILKPYQRERLMGFVRIWTDWESAPYQIKQSMVALGAGGINGVGLGRGEQKLSFLPEANTDFVVAVLGEELGLIGTLGLLTLWACVYLVGLRLLSRLSLRSFEFVVGFVLLTQLMAQALLNVAVVTAMVPPKGISHPLVSYGGSNLVVSLLAIGIFWSFLQNAPSSPPSRSGESGR